VLKHRPSSEHAKFVNLVVLEGDQAKILAPGDPASGCPTPLAAQLGLDAVGDTWGALADRLAPLLLELAASMRAHGHGGTLLVVPESSVSWPLSLARANPYAVTPPYRALAPALPPLAPSGRSRPAVGARRAAPRHRGDRRSHAVDGATCCAAGAR
jgi:hypothetical protein